MNWTIWQDNPKPEKPCTPIARDADGLHMTLVHWTKEEPKECRSIDVKVDDTGFVTVEHSTSEGEFVEHITRYNILGWDEEW